MASASARPSASSGQASVTAVGRPRATSPAKLGPDSTAGAACGRVSARTSVISFSEPCSTPLAQRRTGRPSRACGAKADSVARRCWAGATMRTRSLPARSAKSPVQAMAGSSSTPGRNRRFSWASLTEATTSASRAHSVVESPARAQTWARAVPQAPAPMTAARSKVPLEEWLMPWRPFGRRGGWDRPRRPPRPAASAGGRRRPGDR